MEQQALDQLWPGTPTDFFLFHLHSHFSEVNLTSWIKTITWELTKSLWADYLTDRSAFFHGPAPVYRLEVEKHVARTTDSPTHFPDRSPLCPLRNSSRQALLMMTSLCDSICLLSFNHRMWVSRTDISIQIDIWNVWIIDALHMYEELCPFDQFLILWFSHHRPTLHMAVSFTVMLLT